MTGTIAVGSSAVLGIVAVCFIILILVLAGLMIWAGNSMKRLMPVVASIMVLNAVIQAVRVWCLWMTPTNDEQSEQLQYNQTPPQQSQPRQQSSPTESPAAGLSGHPHQVTDRQQWTTQPVASHDTSRESTLRDSCPKVAYAAHQVRSDLPCDVTMPNDPKLSHGHREPASEPKQNDENSNS